MDDQEELDDAKRRYHSAVADIERLRNKIATEACPLKPGDRVVVKEGERIYEGLVDRIDAAPGIDDFIEPKLGAPTPWVASGRRLRKADGQPGKWGLSIPADAELKDGVWHIPERSIERTLGIL
ncbi:MAG: hypothetical protein ACTHJR_20550 [Sphingomonas sp.]|uniref:hypothetical protein n=1 Tax=Sphingomonas sp. TaxID=28214 RepID=UPI003F7CEDD5